MVGVAAVLPAPASGSPIAKRGPHKKRAAQEIELSKPFVILGAARQAGETRRAVDIAFPNGLIDLTILSEHHVGGYDYAHSNVNDGFLAIVNGMLAAKHRVRDAGLLVRYERAHEDIFRPADRPSRNIKRERAADGGQAYLADRIGHGYRLTGGLRGAIFPNGPVFRQQLLGGWIPLYGR